MKRTRYQFGSVYLKERKRGVAVWVYRYFEDGMRKSVSIGSIEKYPTKADALKASESLRLVANPDKAIAHVVRFGALIDRYIGEELPDRKSTREIISRGSRTGFVRSGEPTQLTRSNRSRWRPG